jgi:MFS family permease
MVIIFCAILLSIGYALMSLVQDVWLFYLIYGVFISLGVGGFWSPLVSTVARWFNRKRGLVTGIVSGGISFGTLVLPLLVTRIIEIYNWRVTYIIMGAAVLVLSIGTVS